MIKAKSCRTCKHGNMDDLWCTKDRPGEFANGDYPIPAGEGFVEGEIIGLLDCWEPIA